MPPPCARQHAIFTLLTGKEKTKFTVVPGFFILRCADPPLYPVADRRRFRHRAEGVGVCRFGQGCVVEEKSLHHRQGSPDKQSTWPARSSNILERGHTSMWPPSQPSAKGHLRPGSSGVVRFARTPQMKVAEGLAGTRRPEIRWNRDLRHTPPFASRGPENLDFIRRPPHGRREGVGQEITCTGSGIHSLYASGGLCHSTVSEYSSQNRNLATLPINQYEASFVDRSRFVSHPGPHALCAIGEFGLRAPTPALQHVLHFYDRLPRASRVSPKMFTHVHGACATNPRDDRNRGIL